MATPFARLSLIIAGIVCLVTAGLPADTPYIYAGTLQQATAEPAAQTMTSMPETLTATMPMTMTTTSEASPTTTPAEDETNGTIEPTTTPSATPSATTPAVTPSATVQALPEAVTPGTTPLPPETATPTITNTATAIPPTATLPLPTSTVIPPTATPSPTLFVPQSSPQLPTVRPIPRQEDDDDDDDDSDDDGDVSLEKRADVASAISGDVVEFTLIVNNEDGRSDDVIVVDDLPEGYEIIEATTTWGTVEVEGNTVRVEIGPLYSDDEVIIRIVTRIDCEPGEEDRTANQVQFEEETINTGIITSSSDDDVVANNESSVVVVCQVAATPTLTPTLTMSPSPTPVPTPPFIAATPPPVPTALPETGMPAGTTAGIPMRLLLLAAGVALLVMGLSIRRQRQR